MGQYAGEPLLGPDLQAIRAEVEREALPFLELDWLVKFPGIAAGDRDHAITFYSILLHAYYNALLLKADPESGEECIAFPLADADFRDHLDLGILSREDYDWCLNKLRRTRDDFHHERESGVFRPFSRDNGDRRFPVRERAQSREEHRRRAAASAPGAGAGTEEADDAQVPPAYNAASSAPL